jgi:hypothetical protein
LVQDKGVLSMTMTNINEHLEQTPKGSVISFSLGAWQSLQNLSF